MKLWLVEITGGLIEIEAETAEAADDGFDFLIERIAECGTLSWRGPMSEEEYEKIANEPTP